MKKVKGCVFRVGENFLYLNCKIALYVISMYASNVLFIESKVVHLDMYVDRAGLSNNLFEDIFVCIYMILL